MVHDAECLIELDVKLMLKNKLLWRTRNGAVLTFANRVSTQPFFLNVQRIANNQKIYDREGAYARKFQQRQVVGQTAAQLDRSISRILRQCPLSKEDEQKVTEQAFQY